VVMLSHHKLNTSQANLRQNETKIKTGIWTCLEMYNDIGENSRQRMSQSQDPGGPLVVRKKEKKIKLQKSMNLANTLFFNNP
jgi:hypothetical protein